MKAKLKGITRKGKARVKQHGEIWEVLREETSVFFTGEKGPWLCLMAGTNIRWVKKSGDANFEVTMVEE